MQKVLVVYATKEGHTGRIARHVGTSLAAKGVSADVQNVAEIRDGVDLHGYDGALLLASVHVGHHERAMVDFVKRERSGLRGLPTAFLSVSLSEAGAEDATRSEDEREASEDDVQGLIEAFFEETGWRPDAVQPVAGALLYTQYGLVARFIMKRIAKKSSAPTDTRYDYEFTDWEALDRFVGEFASTLSGATEQNPHVTGGGAA